MSRLLRLVMALVVCAAPVSAAERRDAASTNEIARAAEVIATVLKAEGQDQVSMGQFAPPPQFANGGGLGLANDLVEALSTLNIQSARKAPLGLSGTYALNDGQLSVKVSCRLYDKNNRTRTEFDFTLQDPDYLTRLFGITTDIPPDQPGNKRREIIREAIDPAPAVAADFIPVVAQHQVTATPLSDYAVEIWVLKAGIPVHMATDADYVPRACHLKDDVAFVDLSRDEIVAVRLINNSDHDAAATITLDGVNSFAFQEDKTLPFKHYIVPSTVNGHPALIKGWFRSNTKSDAFQIGDFANGAFQKLQIDPGAVGAITVTFAAAWERGKPPADEQPQLLAKRGGGGKNAFTQGPTVEQEFKTVDREVGVMRTAITIRYDPREN